jgi:flagellar biosynthetic protein FlhB
VENPPLARSLYRSVEEGQAIPVDLYSAVAAILAYLYRKQVEEKVRRQQAEARARQASARRATASTAQQGAPPAAVIPSTLPNRISEEMKEKP